MCSSVCLGLMVLVAAGCTQQLWRNIDTGCRRCGRTLPNLRRQRLVTSSCGGPPPLARCDARGEVEGGDRVAVGVQEGAVHPVPGHEEGRARSVEERQNVQDLLELQRAGERAVLPPCPQEVRRGRGEQPAPLQVSRPTGHAEAGEWCTEERLQLADLLELQALGMQVVLPRGTSAAQGKCILDM